MMNSIQMLEIKTRFYTVISKLKFILLVLLLYYPVSSLFLLIFILLYIIKEVIYNIQKKNTIIYKYNNKTIGFINGDKNYIHKCMILPDYQKKGLGKLLLNRYLFLFCKKKHFYYFNTSIFLDTLDIYKKYSHCKINTDNFINYKIIVPI